MGARLIVWEGISWMPLLLEAAGEAEGEVVVNSLGVWVPTVLMVGSSCSSLVHKQGVSGSIEMFWHWCSCCLLYQLSGPYVSSSVLPAWRKGEDGETGPHIWSGIISPNTRHLNKVWKVGAGLPCMVDYGRSLQEQLTPSGCWEGTGQVEHGLGQPTEHLTQSAPSGQGKMALHHSQLHWSRMLRGGGDR